LTVPVTKAPHVVPKVIGDSTTILLFGHTGAGKTALIGEYAEYLYATKKQTSRIYTADRGGWETIKPYVQLGIIKVVPMFGDPLIWINHAVRGDLWNAQKQAWEPGIDPNVGMYAFEGMTSFADEMMKWMRNAASNGINIGGQGSFSFTAKEGSESLKVGSNNMAHYQVAQSQVYEVSTLSQHLPGTILWTAGDSRGEDDVAGGVVGPQVAGKAKTGEVPRWFKYTFQVTTEVMPGMEPKHVLYTDSHIELNAKGAKAIANARVPLAGGDAKVPLKIEPASLVKVLELIDKRSDSATDEIAKRLGIKR
jgi:hypothetical protein